jgi:hypothetical protein
MDTICSSETLVGFQHTTQHYIPAGSALNSVDVFDEVLSEEVIS